MPESHLKLVFKLMFFPGLFAACHSKPVLKPCNVKFYIKISNLNYSMAYSLNYIVERDSLKVTFHDGITARQDSFLFMRKLTDSVKSALCDHLTSLNLDSLNESYVNEHIEDGDTKIVVLEVGNKSKHLYTANYELNQLSNIYYIINTMLDKKYHIHYYKKEKVSQKDFGL